MNGFNHLLHSSDGLNMRHLWRPGVKGEAAGRKGEEGSRMGMWCGENGSWGEKGEGKPCWKGVGWTGWTGWWRRRGAGIWDFFLWV